MSSGVQWSEMHYLVLVLVLVSKVLVLVLVLVDDVLVVVGRYFLNVSTEVFTLV